MPPLIKSDPKFPRLDNIRIHLPQGNTIAQSKFNPEYRLYSDIALSDIHPMKLTGKSCVYHGMRLSWYMKPTEIVFLLYGGNSNKFSHT